MVLCVSIVHGQWTSMVLCASIQERYRHEQCHLTVSECYHNKDTNISRQWYVTSASPFTPHTPVIESVPHLANTRDAMLPHKHKQTKKNKPVTRTLVVNCSDLYLLHDTFLYSY